MNRTVRIALVAAVIAIATFPMFAQTSTTALPVNANVVRSCSITTLAAVEFGNYDPVVANATVDKGEETPGQLSVACTKGSAGVTIELGTGANFNWGTRNMIANGEILPYTLYSDGAHTLAWGTAGAGEAYALGAPASKNAQTLAVYGRIPAGVDVTVGAYIDTVTATINF